MEEYTQVPAPLIAAAKNGISDDYLVWIDPGELLEGATSDDLLSDASVPATAVYRKFFRCVFGGRLTEAQVWALRCDPRVAYIEEDIEGHPAPHWKAPRRGWRVHGLCIVTTVENIQPALVADRFDLTPEYVSKDYFVAYLNESELEKARFDHDVLLVADVVRFVVT